MNWVYSHLLTSIIFLPLAGMVIVALLPSRQTRAIRLVSLITSSVVLILAGKAFSLLKGSGEFEFVEIVSWIPSVHIFYKVGIDGVSLLLILLTALLTPIAILASWREIDRNVKTFHILILLLETGMLGVFAALDLFLFYVFWEVVLIPMYFLIGIWGSGRRVRSALKFFIYTMAGSMLMLAAILYASSAVGGSFDLVTWYAHRFGLMEQMFLFGAFAIAFAIKVPIVPFHTWLPDAHTDAPTAGSVILAGVLLKMGTYGFYRFAMPLFPLAVVKFAPLILVLSVIGIIYGGLVAMVQPDIKRLVAYSSVSHLGFVMLGLFSLQPEAAQGAVLQMINHGLSTGALFLMVGMLYERRHTRMIEDYGGVAKSLPVIAAAFILITLSSIGLPGLNNFVGEFLVLLGSFQTRTAYAAVSISGVVISAIYMLWLVQRVFFGEIKKEENLKLHDLSVREYWVLAPIVILIFFIGVWPRPWISRIERSTNAFLTLSKRVEMVVPVPSSEPAVQNQKADNVDIQNSPTPPFSKGGNLTPPFSKRGGEGGFVSGLASRGNKL